jgi:hypothetical protein
VVISGGAAGSDELAALAAVELGYSEDDGTLLIYRPRVRRLHGPGGYRARDEQIAQACTHLLRIYCQQATTYGSGWTADRAEDLGAIVVRYNACLDRSYATTVSHDHELVQGPLWGVPAADGTAAGPAPSAGRP